MKRRRIADAHAHIYPERIAEKASNAVGDFYGIPLHQVGTAGALLREGKKIGAERYLVCAVATRAEQVDSVNRFIAASCRENPAFVGLGAYHQDITETVKVLEDVKKAGLRGIKLHPDFQQFNLDAPRMVEVYKELVKLDLCVLFHIGDNRFDFSAPERLARVMEAVPGLRCIAAHLGGYRYWGKGLRLLRGADLMFDTSSSLMFLEPGEAAGLIRETGFERFLFGTDFPMWTHEKELERFMGLDLTEEERTAILYDNFAKFFGLDVKE